MPRDLPSGSVDVLLLKALSWGPQHGFWVSRWVRARSDGALGLDDAALYQGLHRCERRGWVTSEWGISENNRRAKYYELTPEGRSQLRADAAAWRGWVVALTKILDARTAEIPS